MTRRVVVAVTLALVGWGCDDGEPTVELLDAIVEGDSGEPVDVADGALLDAGPDAAPDAVPDAALPPCPAPDPPPEALRRVGPTEDGGYLTPGGRLARSPGPSARVEGFPIDVVTDASGALAYAVSASRDDHLLIVVDLVEHRVVQTIERDDAFRGLVLSPAGDALYNSAGYSGRVDVFPIGPDGLLGEPSSVEVGPYPAGMAHVDGRLWVAVFAGAELVEIDLDAGEVARRVEVPGNPWAVAAAGGVLFVSDLAGETIVVVDPEAGEVIDTLDAPTSPAGMAVDPAGGRLWAAVSGADAIVEIDAAARQIVGWTPAAGDDWTDDDGAPLPNSNVNALAYDPATDRLYASRGADNAISVFDADTMALLGALPTGWYPTALALAGGETPRLVVTEGKGSGAGPSVDDGVKDLLAGTISAVALDGLDLDAATAIAEAGYARPSAVFPYACDEGRFPIPTRVGQRSPIEHVVLIVKENKTFDCVFGDLADALDVTADPSLVRWGEEITPNQHALAREYCLLDNFYTEVANSDQGHIYLTSAHLTEYVERVWVEQTRSGIFGGFQIVEASIPDKGNFFSHLVDHGVEIGIHGEIVGMFAKLASGGFVITHSDRTWPGGPATNYAVDDVDKAQHFIDRVIERGELPTFSYVLLPNDHTNGTDPGRPTPESMVADNDRATGMIVEALAASPYWSRTLVLIVEDDTQGCQDHVDGHRSYLIAVGPWVRRGHVSHVHGSFLSIFATIERVVGVPPIGRPDASAMPLWDCMTGTPDPTPFTARPRGVPVAYNPEDAPGAEQSRRMDWRSPDRNPGLGVILDSYRLWRMGRIDRAEADRRIAAGPGGGEDWDDAVEESREEATAFDRDWVRYVEWRAEQGLDTPEPWGKKAP